MAYKADVQVYVLAYTRYRYLMENGLRREAVRRLAKDLGYKEKSVSGMLTRAEQDKTISELALLRYKSKNHSDYSDKQIEARIESDKRKFTAHMFDMDKPYNVLFWTDVHVPYHLPSALELMFQIVEGVPNLRLANAFSDGLDFPNLSRFEDRRTVKEQAQSRDWLNSLDIYMGYVNTLRLIKPSIEFVAVMGNHDVRIATHGNDTSDRVLQFMEKSPNVMFTSHPRRESGVVLDHGLALTHGSWYSSKTNLGTNTDRNVTQLRRELKINQPVYALMGHMHKFAYGNDGLSVGCLCSDEPFYSRKRENWDLGFAYATIYPAGYTVTPVQFKSVGSRLLAEHGGKSYEIQI